MIISENLKNMLRGLDLNGALEVDIEVIARHEPDGRVSEETVVVTADWAEGPHDVYLLSEGDNYAAFCIHKKGVTL